MITFQKVINIVYFARLYFNIISISNYFIGNKMDKTIINTELLITNAIALHLLLINRKLIMIALKVLYKIYKKYLHSNFNFWIVVIDILLLKTQIYLNKSNNPNAHNFLFIVCCFKLYIYIYRLNKELKI